MHIYIYNIYTYSVLHVCTHVLQELAAICIYIYMYSVLHVRTHVLQELAAMQGCCRVQCIEERVRDFQGLEVSRRPHTYVSTHLKKFELSF